MLTGVKDIDMIILNNLEDIDLVRTCQVNKLADNICKDQTFWLNRILSKYPYLSLDILNKYKGDRSWSQYYIEDLRKINRMNANGSLIGATFHDRLDYAMIAVNNGADIHYLNDIAFLTASSSGNIEMVKYLVKMGANIHADNDYAAKYANEFGYMDMVDYLVSLGVKNPRN